MNSVLIGIPCLKVGGTEIQTLRLVEALVSGGYHCVTVCYFEYDFAMVQQFEKAGSRVICLSAYGRRPKSSRDVYKFLKRGLKRVVEEYRPKIAHVQYMAPGAIPIVILYRLGVKNIIATLHTDADIYKNLRLVRFAQRLLTRVFQCVTQKAESNFFGSSNLYDDNYQFQRHNHITIHNCLPDNYIFGSQNAKEINSPITIGVVARLETIKGTDVVIPAFAKVLERYPDCRLIIVGDGKLRTEMERQQQQFGVADDKIQWLGRVAYEALPELYQQMDIVWGPSRSEGFGLSAVEAMAQGCAVIASDTGGLSEIIHDGEDGLLCKIADYDDLANKTISLIGNPQLHSQIKEKAIITAKQYSFDIYKNKILQLYKSLKQ